MERLLTVKTLAEMFGHTLFVLVRSFGDVRSGVADHGEVANLDPERRFPSLFKPVHGSAPDIYGKNIANPIGAIWSDAMMLDFLGQGEGAGWQAHDAILTAIQKVLKEGPRAGDLGGKASTTDMGQAIAVALTAQAD